MSSFSRSINFEDEPLFASLHRDSVLQDYENSDDPILTLKVRQVYYEYTKKILESNASETGIHISHDVIVNVAREIELLALRMCMSSSLYREIMISKIDHIKYLTTDKYAVFSTAKDNSENTVLSEELGIPQSNTVNDKLRESRLSLYFERYTPSVCDEVSDYNKYTSNGSKNKSCTCSSNNSEQETCGYSSESDYKRRKPNIVEDLSENKEPDKLEIISEIQQPDSDISPEMDIHSEDQLINEIVIETESPDILESIPENQKPIKVEVETLQHDNIEEQAQIPLIKVEGSSDETPTKVEDNSDVFDKVYDEMSKLFEQDPPENNNAMSETSSNPVSDTFFSCADKNFWYMEHVINESKTEQNLSAKYDLNEKKYENAINKIENLLGPPGEFMDYSIKKQSHICKKRIAWHVRNSLSVYYKRKYFRSVDEFRILAKNIVSKLQGIDPYIDYKLIYRAISRAFNKKRIIIETISQIQCIVMKVADYVTHAKSS